MKKVPAHTYTGAELARWLAPEESLIREQEQRRQAAPRLNHLIDIAVDALTVRSCWSLVGSPEREFLKVVVHLACQQNDRHQEMEQEDFDQLMAVVVAGHA